MWGTLTSCWRLQPHCSHVKGTSKKMVSIIVNDESRRIQKFDPFGLTIIYLRVILAGNQPYLGHLGATVPTCSKEVDTWHRAVTSHVIAIKNTSLIPFRHLLAELAGDATCTHKNSPVTEGKNLPWLGFWKTQFLRSMLKIYSIWNIK